MYIRVLRYILCCLMFIVLFSCYYDDILYVCIKHALSMYSIYSYIEYIFKVIVVIL